MRRTWLSLGAVHVGVAVLVGWSWWRLAPRVQWLASDGQPIRLEEQTGQVFGADATFAVLCLAAGLALGGLGFTLARRAPRGLLSGLAVGGLLGSLAAWQLGEWLDARRGADSLSEQAARAPDLAELTGPLQLAATQALIVWPLVAVVVVLAALWISGERSEPSPPG